MKIDKIEIRNFKKFKGFEFSNIPDRCALVGANGSGKTTLLQAVATWTTLCNKWLAGTNLKEARDKTDQEYKTVPINRKDLHSAPLAKFMDLWTEQKTDQSIYISLEIRGLKIAFEIKYGDAESAKARPHTETDEDALAEAEKILTRQALPVIYIPHFSAIQRNEERNADQFYVVNKLAEGRTGEVFRNLLVEAYNDQNVWENLCEIANRFFGYNLSTPSVSGVDISDGYRHLVNANTTSPVHPLDFTTAASGFLQTMMIFASVLLHKNTTILIDEPDSHLHMFLQKNLVNRLKEYSNENKNRLIVATHSPAVIDLFDLHQIGVIRDNKISFGEKGEQEKGNIVDTLSLSHTHIAFATQQRKILYVEGHVDERVIHAWAKTMKHPVSKFLDGGSWVEEQENPWNKDVTRHFKALKTIAPDILGFCLRDGDNRGIAEDAERKNGLMIFNWNWYSIESYLLNWDVLERYLKGRDVPEKNIEEAKKDFYSELPPNISDNPGKDNKKEFLKKTESKSLLSGFLEAASQSPLDNDATVEIAQTMLRDEIPGEVEELLDTMAKHLQISE